MKHLSKRAIVSLLLSIIIGTGTIFYIAPIMNVSPIIFIFVYVALFPLFYSVATGWLFEPYQYLPRPHQIATGLVYAVLASYVTWSLKGSQTYLADNSSVTKAFVFISAYILLVTLCLLIVRLTCVLNYEQNRVKKRSILIYSIPSLLVGMIYLLALYPGIMTYDSLLQWDQAHRYHFNNWHPVVHTWFILAVTTVWDSPAAVALVQVLIFSLITGYGAYCFRNFGVNRLIIAIALLFVALHPIHSMFAITLWKDVLYSIMILLFTICLANIIITKGRWMNSIGGIILFIIASCGVVFFRHNGFPVFAATIAILFLFYRFKLWRMYISSALVVILYLIVTGPVFTALQVVPSDPNEAWGIPTQQIASVIANDGVVTEEQKEFLDNVFPLELWKEKYNPYLADPVKGHPEYNREFLYKHKKEYFQTWLALCKQNPGMVINAYLQQASIVWKIKPYEGSYTYTAATDIGPPDLLSKLGYSFSERPVSPTLHNFILNLQWGSQFSLLLLLWRPALYLFGIVLFAFACILRSNWRIALAASPALLNAAAVAAALPAQDVRYLYANILVFIPFFLAAFLPNNILERIEERT